MPGIALARGTARANCRHSRGNVSVFSLSIHLGHVALELIVKSSIFVMVLHIGSRDRGPPFDFHQCLCLSTLPTSVAYMM